MSSEPLKLSDESLLHLLRLAQPLHQHDRSAFLEAVAGRLAGVPELGDGIVARVGAEVQSRYLRPTTTHELRTTNKYNRNFRKNGNGSSS